MNHHVIHKDKEMSLCGSSRLCISFPPASAFHPAHFPGQLTETRAPSIMPLFLPEEGLFQNKKSHIHTMSCFRSSSICLGVLCCKYKNRLDHEIKRGFKRCTGNHKINFPSRMPLDEHVMLWAGNSLSDFSKWSAISECYISLNFLDWKKSFNVRVLNDDFWHFLVHAHSFLSRELQVFQVYMECHAWRISTQQLSDLPRSTAATQK